MVGGRHGGTREYGQGHNSGDAPAECDGQNVGPAGLMGATVLGGGGPSCGWVGTSCGSEHFDDRGSNNRGDHGCDWVTDKR